MFMFGEFKDSMRNLELIRAKISGSGEKELNFRILAEEYSNVQGLIK